jgi:hypothetical protein
LHYSIDAEDEAMLTFIETIAKSGKAAKKGARAK